jgi:transposase, IS30 family
MFTQFTKEKRVELSALLRAKHSHQECADLLLVHKSSVTREINRNRDEDGIYRASHAHKKFLKGRVSAKEKTRKIQNDPKLRTHIKKRLLRRDSPEQISGRIKRTKKFQNVSYETIYEWIYSEEPRFKKQLRRIGHKGKYYRKRGTKVRENVRDEAKVKRIDTRPKEVETRERIGDWEGDTLIGSDKITRLVSNVERKSGYGLLDKMSIVTKENMHGTLQKRFSKITKEKRKTYTYNNGVELGEEDTDLEKKIGMEVFRAFPYHSWERGTNENWNGLVRDFLPKKTNFAILTNSDVKRVERNLNHRPRKRLGFLTPHEVFVLGVEVGAVQG